MKPFRFLAEARAIATAGELGETARHAESTGIDTLVIPDHLIPQLAPIPAMATIAAVTERLRISGFVLNNDLRHPAVLAQDLASLDVLSEGRLDVAIGAGWNRPEYDAVGLSFDSAPVRQARLAEAIAVLKGCFADGPFSFSGTHYTITDHDAHPKPVQQPHPPFLIGGGGRRTLALAGREAQIVGLAPRILPNGAGDPASVTVAATAEKIAWAREASGDRADQLDFNIYPSMTGISITDHARREAEQLADRLEGPAGWPSPPMSCSNHRTSSSGQLTPSSKSSSDCEPSWESARSWSARWASSPGWSSAWPADEEGPARRIGERGSVIEYGSDATASRRRWPGMPGRRPGRADRRHRWCSSG